jgi:hypothetical protein
MIPTHPIFMKKIYLIIFVLGLFVFFHTSFAQTPPSTLDLKANGSDGPLTVLRDSDVLLSWKYAFHNGNPLLDGLESTATTRGQCTASGSWGGAQYKNDIGQEFTGALTSNRIYTLTCAGLAPTGGGTVAVVDTIVIYVTDKLPTPTPTPVPTIAACDATSQAVVNAAGGCGKIDSSLYKHVYSACCSVITKESLLQILDAALADGVLDKTEKLSLLNALDTYLSRL